MIRMANHGAPPHEAHPRRAVPAVVLAVAASTLVLGCMPAALLRPPLPMLEGMENEVGGGGVAVSPPPYTIDPWYGSSHFWFRHRQRPRLTLAAIAGFDLEAAFVGGGLTVDYVNLTRFVGAVDLEGGWGWVNLSLPFGVRMWDGGWLYAAPRLGTWGQHAAIFLLAGVDFRLKGPWHLRAEYQVSWEEFAGYNRRHHIGGGLAYQF